MATDVIARGMASNSLKEAKAYTDTFNGQVTNIAPTSDGTGLIFTVIGGQTFTIGVDDWNALPIRSLCFGIQFFQWMYDILSFSLPDTFSRFSVKVHHDK